MKAYLDTLRRAKQCLLNPSEAIKKSLQDVHSKNVFSLVLDGEENGKLLRVFICDKKLKPFEVQLHSHRYGINLYPIAGNIIQHVAIPGNQLQMPTYRYKSFLNGGNGLSFMGVGNYNITSHQAPVGSKIHMSENEVHTMSCSKGSIWMVEELGFAREDSIVLGVPFTVEGLYRQPDMFQINDKCQTVLKHITELIKNFESINN